MKRAAALLLGFLVGPASAQTIAPNDVLGPFISPQSFSDGITNAPAEAGVCNPSALLIQTGSKLLIQTGSVLEISAC